MPDETERTAKVKRKAYRPVTESFEQDAAIYVPLIAERTACGMQTRLWETRLLLEVVTRQSIVVAAARLVVGGSMGGHVALREALKALDHA